MRHKVPKEPYSHVLSGVSKQQRHLDKMQRAFEGRYDVLGSLACVPQVPHVRHLDILSTSWHLCDAFQRTQDIFILSCVSRTC